MKNLLYLVMALFLAISVMMPETAQGQICTPDTQYKDVGFFPSVLPPLCNNSPYNEAITVVIPQDTNVNFPPFGVVKLDVDSVVVNNVTDLPTGITYSCNPANCSFLGGTSGCIVLSGTPSVAGTFLVDLDVSLYLTFAGNSVVFPAVLTDTIELNVNPELTATVSTQDAACGIQNGTAKVSVTSAAPATSYLWDTGATTDSIGNMAAGNYTVTVTDTNGCTKTFNVSIGQLASDLSIDSAASVIEWMGCAESDGGKVAPSVMGTAGPITYSWSNTSTDSSLTSLPSGSYTLTVTDANSCIDIQTFEVSAPDTLVVTQSGEVVDVECNGESTGEATIAVTGGDGNYTYNWDSNPAQTSATATSLPAGMYTASVSDGNGCTKTLEVNITEPDAITIVLNVMDEGMAGANDGAIVSNVSGGTPPYTFTWDGVDTTADLTDLAPGSYELVVTDSLGCTNNQTATIMAGTPSSLEGISGLLDLRLYPNPSQGSFSLELEMTQAKELQIVVLNMHGQALIKRSTSLNSVIKEDFQLQKRGIYLMQIKSGEEISTLKVMVK